MSCCGLSGPHFICKGCGLHVVTDFEPCPSCSYFKFEPVRATEMQVPTPELQVVAVTPTATRSPRRNTRRAAQ